MILLVHGLWFGPWTLRPLARRLSRSGERVLKFKYQTTRQTLRQNAKALLKFARDLEAEELNFVAHSLGGLVTLKALNLAAGAGEPLPPGRVVLLGSPLSGSRRKININRDTSGQEYYGQQTGYCLFLHLYSL